MGLTAEDCIHMARTGQMLDIISHVVQRISASPRYVWVDCLCLNQASQADISAAIPHMAEWYRLATECHAYPFGFDVSVSVRSMQMASPRWFQRAWTLQEYLMANETKAVYLFGEAEFETVRAIGKACITFQNAITGRSIMAVLTWGMPPTFLFLPVSILSKPRRRVHGTSCVLR